MGYHSDDVPDSNEQELHRDGGVHAGWSFHQGRAVVRLELEYGKEEMETIPQVLKLTRTLQKRLLQPPALPNGRLSVTWRYPPALTAAGIPRAAAYLQSDVPGGATWLSAPRYAIRGSRMRPKPLIGVDDLDKIGILRMFAQNRGKRWVAAEERNAFPLETDEGSEANESRHRRRHHGVTVSGILKVLADAAAGHKLFSGGSVENLQDRIKSLFSRICAPKRYVGYVYFGPTDVVGAPLLEEAGRQYPLEMAATGEQVILDYLTQFVYPRPVNNSVILIDEPELHLHPHWIRQLYRALPQMGRNNQFVMTTHSAELRQLAAEENAVIDLGSLEASGTVV
jgi:hypothetical protein